MTAEVVTAIGAIALPVAAHCKVGAEHHSRHAQATPKQQSEVSGPELRQVKVESDGHDEIDTHLADEPQGES